VLKALSICGMFCFETGNVDISWHQLALLGILDIVLESKVSFPFAETCSLGVSLWFCFGCGNCILFQFLQVEQGQARLAPQYRKAHEGYKLSAFINPWKRFETPMGTSFYIHERFEHGWQALLTIVCFVSLTSKLLLRYWSRSWSESWEFLLRGKESPAWQGAQETGPKSTEVQRRESTRNIVFHFCSSVCSWCMRASCWHTRTDICREDLAKYSGPVMDSRVSPWCNQTFNIVPNRT
jgi:hypothetical protein